VAGCGPAVQALAQRGAKAVSRRLAREAALRSLFQVAAGHNSPAEALQYNNSELGLTEPAARYAETVVQGVLQHLAELDALIGQLTLGWAFARLSGVDKAVLRMAIFELQYMREDIPAAVAINEAVELAKTYGDEASARFVNGVLAIVVRERPST
jgi:N utilization substance protein B